MKSFDSATLLAYRREERIKESQKKLAQEMILADLVKDKFNEPSAGVRSPNPSLIRGIYFEPHTWNPIIIALRVPRADKAYRMVINFHPARDRLDLVLANSLLWRE